MTTAASSEQTARVVESVGASVVRVEGGRPASGVVWAAGVVVTAAHALEERASTVKVGFADERQVDAEVVARDRRYDLAVLRVDTGSAPVLQRQSGGALAVGHFVLRLARPGRTVRATFGIISALGNQPYRVRGGAQIERYLESDAGHPTGFSGGPLVDLEGAFLGLNTAGLIRGEVPTLPASTVEAVVSQVLQHGKVRRSYLGVSSQPVRLPDAVRAQTGDEVGLLIVGVEPGGPADRAGIAFGDTLLDLGREDVRDLADVRDFLSADHVGETVHARLWRAGQVRELDVVVGERP